MTRDQVFRLQFIHRCIHMYNVKLFLELYQVIDVELAIPRVYHHCFSAPIVIDLADVSHAVAYKQQIRCGNYELPETELTEKELDYLFEQCEFQLQEQRRQRPESMKNCTE